MKKVNLILILAACMTITFGFMRSKPTENPIGINIGNTSGFQQPSSSSSSSEDAATKLQQAKQMLENKLITDAEYETIKARIISSM